MTLLIDEPAVARRDAGVVRVTGADRLGYLHTLLSQALEGTEPGHCADFLYLDAKGNPQAAGRAVVGEQAVLLVVPPGVAAGLAEALERYRFLMDVSAVDCGDAWALASVRGPRAVDVPGAPATPMTAAAAGGGVLGEGPGLLLRDRSGGVDLLGTAAWVDERVAALDVAQAGEREWDAWRILAGEPAWGREIAPGQRPQELGLLPTHVHLRKGCYPGQESIAKTYNLGRPRRALAVVRLDRPVTPGSELRAGEGRGRVTSVAATGEGAVALALLPLDRDSGEIAGDGTVAGEDARGHVLGRVGAGLPQPGA